jgi:hypothetical protein
MHRLCALRVLHCTSEEQGPHFPPSQTIFGGQSLLDTHACCARSISSIGREAAAH